MCGLGWLYRLCWLCVPLSLGVLRRRSLLSLRSHVGIGLRLRSHVRVWRLRSRVGARGLRTGVRALRRSLALSGRGGLCLERLRLGGLCLGLPLPLERNPLCLEAQRILARRRRHITVKSPGASRSAIPTLRGQAICEVAAGLKLADKRNDPKNA